jgi:Flp pilus assembly protein CpaB
MSRRARAIGFAAAALACAALAAAVAGGYRTDLEGQLGPLRRVVVTRDELLPTRPLRPADASRLLEVRRIPERFAPPGALTAPQQAVGRAPTARIPAGAYVLASQLRAGAGHRHRGRPRLDAGREPVEISVTEAEALAAGGGNPEGSRVDVIVTTEPGPGGGDGRTYVAAEGVELLALGESGDPAAGDGLPGSGPAGTWTATLALTRPQALRLIHAENFARQVRLIAH